MLDRPVCVAAGSRRIRYIIRCTFGQGHALLHSSSPPSNFALLACIPDLPAVFLPLLRCCFLLPPSPLSSAVSLAASTRRLDRCARAQAKSAFPNANGRSNLDSLTLLPMADGHAKQIPTAKA